MIVLGFSIYIINISLKYVGGVERVRTSAPLTRPNCLANNPLHHLGTTPFCFGGEGGIRTHGKLFTYANFQDWCLKPTRPPLQILVPSTVLILPYLYLACQVLFCSFFLFLHYLYDKVIIL